ncbi:MAG: 5'/3'-nucleotidase SurE [Clostridia bacterium]|nr:5'/3'-nucleotidase SurE [Clostridia bacterium]
MRILIVNDDGIFAPGIIALANWAKQYGDVTLVAPKLEQSGKSHSIDIVHSFEIIPVEHPTGVRAYQVDSSPADCTRYAYKGLHETFDLVLSGINRGYNLGEDMMYSGTIGAATEAASMGANALALSTDFTSLEEAEKALDEVYQFVCENNLFSYHNLYNINIPPKHKGILITRQGGPYYKDEFVETAPSMYYQEGSSVYVKTDDMTLDTNATLGGYISISPLTIKRTELSVFDKLRAMQIDKA